MNNKFCFNHGDLKIKGYWDEQEVKYVQVKLMRCMNNSANGNKCKSNEEIDKFFSEPKYFDVYFLNPFIDFNDYDSPIKYVLRTEYQRLDPNAFKGFNLYFKNLNLLMKGIFLL